MEPFYNLYYSRTLKITTIIFKVLVQIIVLCFYIYMRCEFFATPLTVPGSSILSYIRVVNPYIRSWDTRAYSALVRILTALPGDTLARHLGDFLTSLSIFSKFYSYL